MNNNEQQQPIMSETTNTEIFRFCPETGVAEYHTIIHVTDTKLTFTEQAEAVRTAFCRLLEGELKGAVPVFKRYFLSDAANQADLLLGMEDESPDCPLSIVEQPPLDKTKIALWAYLQTGVQSRVLHNGLFEVKHGVCRHLWGAAAYNHAANSEYQTRLLLNDYVMQLMEEGCKLADNCIRTWFFVQNVDVNYAGVVQARNEVFDREGLTSQTHFIASTGICGRYSTPQEIVGMEAYAVTGIRPEQMGYLYAPEYLNPTYEYGVAFERGTYVDYGDRRHVFISGTASINNRGEVVYPGDIVRQTLRMWENVAALLAEADMDFSDIGHMIVYLRDPSDYAVVNELFDCRFPDVPRILVWAPVCRPGWLIEMECMASRKRTTEGFADF